MSIVSNHIQMLNKCMVVAIIFLIFATTWSFAGITGSAHDFSAEAWNTNQEICIVCHTPHNASQTVTEAPLWNHALSVETNYTLYNSATMVQQTVQPLGISKLCLSCHDGTIAVNSFGNQTGGTKIQSGDAGYIGTDLSDDHPVSVLWMPGGMSWHPTLAGSGPVDCLKCHDNIGEGPEKLPLPFYTYGGGKGTARLECSTCHDPHNKGTNNKMLRRPNDNSEICLWCHNK